MFGSVPGERQQRVSGLAAPSLQPARARQRSLNQMKALALALLVFAAVLYLSCLSFTDGKGGWGFLAAGAEASMVGGLADWFAVTALFRHPLGLPVPHTAIIPRKKDQIGESLALFVEENFLTVAVVGHRIAASQFPLRIGTWLAEPRHADRLARETLATFGSLERAWHDEEIGAAIAAYAEGRLRKIDVAPALAKVIDSIRAGGQHQLALTVVLRSFSRFLNENKAIFRQRLREESPEWVPEWVDDRVFRRLYAGLQKLVTDVTSFEGHELRRQYDIFLADYANSLRTDPDRAAAVNTAKLDFLERPEVRAWLDGLWQRTKASALEDIASEESQLRTTLESLILRFGSSLRDDKSLQQRLEKGLAKAVDHVITHYSHEITNLISATVSRWDAADTGRRLELQVGRDLQFVRINGTVVGALAGIGIHAVSMLV